MQDSALINKLKNVLTGRIIKWLQDDANKVCPPSDDPAPQPSTGPPLINDPSSRSCATQEPEKYLDFFLEFGGFLKEGACTDSAHKVSPFPAFTVAGRCPHDTWL